MSAPAAEDYAQGDRFQVEKRRLFARAWLPLCAAGQLAATGAFVNHTLGGWPIFAIRGADGEVRAFRNVCRHQGMPLVEKPAGQCDVLRCRYHGWTYDLTGAFVSAPPLVAPEDPAAPMHHLEVLTLAETAGLIQVRGRGPDPGAPPPIDVGGAFTAAVTTDVDANWKAAVEHLLADPSWRFVWPLAFMRGGVVRQIVPRTFLRTRVVDLAFGGAADAEAAQRDKAGAEALQARRAAGDTASDVPAVAAFRDRLAAACAG